MDLSGDTLVYIIGGLAFLVIAGVGLAFAGDSGSSKATKRLKQFESGESSGGRGASRNDPNYARRKQTQQMLQKLRDQDVERRKSLVAKDIDSKIQQAGLTIAPSMFWVLSIIVGIVAMALVWYSGAEGLPPIMGLEIKSRPGIIIAAGIAGGIGLPRWVLGFLTKRRTNKMVHQFGDGIDIIVRGVKSGLPLTECLRIIAAESPAPLGPEFQQLTDNIQMGTTMERALLQFYRRVPLPEVNFFVIVLTIQAKAGGNLSEALGNLSAVIRSRRMMREKIKALSSEAKASAMIIGCLPFAVTVMVYLTTPDYIMELFITSTGHMILFMAACLMTIGITVIRKMISFDF